MYQLDHGGDQKMRKRVMVSERERERERDTGQSPAVSAIPADMQGCQ